MKKNIIKISLIFFVLTIGYILLFSQDSLLNSSKKEAVKKVLQDINKAPDFTLKALNDSSYTLSELEGKVVLINFWATWCGPCRMEIPDLNELYKTYKDLDLEILAISTSDSKKRLKEFINAYNIFYPVLYVNKI